jgi:hypothetical protein
MYPPTTQRPTTAEIMVMIPDKSPAWASEAVVENVGVAAEVNELEGLTLDVSIEVVDEDEELVTVVEFELAVPEELEDGVCDQMVFVPETNGKVTETDVGSE